jgi:hypothetical protein
MTTTMNQTCPDTNDVNSSRFAVLYRLATGTLDLQTAQGLLPGGAGRCCESQWGFEYGGDARRCEASLYAACGVEHPQVILTMREEPWEVIGVTQNPKVPTAIDDLEEFLEVSDPMFDTAPVSRVTHYLWARGRSEESIYNSPLFGEIWGVMMHNILNTPQDGFISFN